MSICLKKNQVIKPKYKSYTYTIQAFDAVEELTTVESNDDDDEDGLNPFYGFYASTYYTENKKELQKIKKEGKPFWLTFFVGEEVELLLLEEDRKFESWRILVTKAKNSKPVSSFECYLKTSILKDLI
jgi:hypothetical protein